MAQLGPSARSRLEPLFGEKRTLERAWAQGGCGAAHAGSTDGTAEAGLPDPVWRGYILSRWIYPLDISTDGEGELSGGALEAPGIARELPPEAAVE